MSDQLTGLSTVLDHLDLYAEGLHQAATLAANEIAAVLEAYAKSHHPWKDRTTATTNSVKGRAFDGGDVIDIYIAAGMDYDVFLELARGGKWAWLWPAIEANVERIRAILVKHLGAATIQGAHGSDVTEL